MKPRSERRCYGCNVPIDDFHHVVSFCDPRIGTSTSVDLCGECFKDAHLNVQWYHGAVKLLSVPSVVKRRAINRLKGW